MTCKDEDIERVKFKIGLMCVSDDQWFWSLLVAVSNIVLFWFLIKAYRDIKTFKQKIVTPSPYIKDHLQTYCVFSLYLAECIKLVIISMFWVTLFNAFTYAIGPKY